jgi:hypothetical protein
MYHSHHRHHPDPAIVFDSQQDFIPLIAEK